MKHSADLNERQQEIMNKFKCGIREARRIDNYVIYTSRNMTDRRIHKLIPKIKEEIAKALSQEDIIIPWCAKIDEISLISC